MSAPGRNDPLKTVEADFAGPQYLHFCIGAHLLPLKIKVRDTGVKTAQCDKCRKLFVDSASLHAFRAAHRGRSADPKAEAI